MRESSVKGDFNSCRDSTIIEFDTERIKLILGEVHDSYVETFFNDKRLGGTFTKLFNWAFKTGICEQKAVLYQWLIKLVSFSKKKVFPVLKFRFVDFLDLLIRYLMIFEEQEENC